MKQYSTFNFHSYEFDASTQEIHLRYGLDASTELSTNNNIEFTETLTLPSEGLFLDPINEPLLDKALFLLHLLGGVSYYKACLPPSIIVESGDLTADQATFFNTVYQKGLGEFFYQNNITDHQVQFPISATATNESVPFVGDYNRTLVPFGGGKDSIVTTEMLRGVGRDMLLFRMGGHPLIDAAVAVSDLPCVTIERQLDTQLFELNKQGALNGHVPITAYLSAVTLIMSILYGCSEVAMSNERSANEGNTTLGDLEVNHQWSKSVEFELMLKTYIHQNLSPDLEYFSLLRPMSELQIVQMFSQVPQYFEVFTSCNANWRIAREKPSERWLAEPKTAFAYILCAAFLPKEDLQRIFTKDYLDEASLLTTYKELLGTEGIKPFECVGTPTETKAAFYLAHKLGDHTESAAMKMFTADVLPHMQNPDALVAEVLAPVDEHTIPSSILNLFNAPE